MNDDDRKFARVGLPIFVVLGLLFAISYLIATS